MVVLETESEAAGGLEQSSLRLKRRQLPAGGSYAFARAATPAPQRRTGGGRTQVRVRSVGRPRIPVGVERHARRRQACSLQSASSCTRQMAGRSPRRPGARGRQSSTVDKHAEERAPSTRSHEDPHRSAGAARAALQPLLVDHAIRHVVAQGAGFSAGTASVCTSSSSHSITRRRRRVLPRGRPAGPQTRCAGARRDSPSRAGFVFTHAHPEHATVGNGTQRDKRGAPDGCTLSSSELINGKPARNLVFMQISPATGPPRSQLVGQFLDSSGAQRPMPLLESGLRLGPGLGRSR